MLAESGWREIVSAFRFATIIQRRLRDIGLAVKIRTVESATLIKKFIDQGHFEAIILGWNISQDPDIYAVWYSHQRP